MTPLLPIPLISANTEQLRSFEALLREVNRRFNLISRGEEGVIWEHHILHCLMFAIRSVPAGSRIVDWGTGGGLPAIPLSIVWPNARVVAVDSNAKKTRAVTLFARRLGLENCAAVHCRAEDVCADQLGSGTVWSVSRATAPLSTLWSWHEQARSSVAVASSAAPPGAVAGAGTRADAGMGEGEGADVNVATDAVPDGVTSAASETSCWEPGLLCLKGGDLGHELDALSSRYTGTSVRIYDVRDYLDTSWFAQKKLLHVTDTHGTES